MPLNFRSHRRRVKPTNIRLRYDRGYWGRLGLPQPIGFWPMFGPGPNGTAQDLSPSKNNCMLGSGVTFGASQLGISMAFASTNSAGVLGSTCSLGTSHTIAFWYYSTGSQVQRFPITSVGTPQIAVRLGTTLVQYQTTSGGNAVFGSLPATSDSTWYLFVFTRSGTVAVTLSIFGLTGQLLYSGTASLTSNVNFSFTQFGYSGGLIIGNLGSALVIPGPMNLAQAVAYAQNPWAMFGYRDVAFGTSAGPVSTTGAGMLSARATLLASNLFGARMRVAASQSDIASSIYGAEGQIVSTKTIIASSVKAAAAGIHASYALIASSLRAASASIRASATGSVPSNLASGEGSAQGQSAKSVTHNLTSAEASFQARSAEIASSIIAAVAHIQALSSQTNSHVVQALAQFAATGNPHVLTNLLDVQERLSSVATLINRTTRTAAGSIGSEAAKSVTLNLLHLAEHIEALSEELANEIEQPGAGGGARATVIASNPCQVHSGVGASAQVFSTSGRVAITAWARVSPTCTGTVNVSPKALAEVDVGY